MRRPITAGRGTIKNLEDALRADFSTKEAVDLLGIKFGRFHVWMKRGVIKVDQDESGTGHYKRLSLWHLIEARTAWVLVGLLQSKAVETIMSEIRSQMVLHRWEAGDLFLDDVGGQIKCHIFHSPVEGLTEVALSLGGHDDLVQNISDEAEVELSVSLNMTRIAIGLTTENSPTPSAEKSPTWLPVFARRERISAE